MKNLILFTLLLTQSIPTAYAGRTILETVTENYNEVYSKLGKDNNYISQFHFHNTLSQNVLNKFPSAEIENIPSKMRKQVLGECLFIRRGAYGEHITAQDQTFLAQRFLTSLRQAYVNMPEILLVKNISTDIISNNCGILLVDHTNQQMLIMQGVSVD